MLAKEDSTELTRFGIAFSRIYEQGGYLVYKKSCTNKTLYEGKLLTRLK